MSLFSFTPQVFITSSHISDDCDDWRKSRFEAVVSASEAGLAQQEKSVRRADKTSKDSASSRLANLPTRPPKTLLANLPLLLLLLGVRVGGQNFWRTQKMMSSSVLSMGKLIDVIMGKLFLLDDLSV